MNDAEEIRCPICGSDEISWGYSFPPGQGNAQCHADGCEVIAVGDDQQEALSKFLAGAWTHRVVAYDDNGHPLIEARK